MKYGIKLIENQMKKGGNFLYEKIKQNTKKQ